MIQFYVQQWEANKHKLEEYYRSLNDTYISYKDVVKATIEHALPQPSPEYYSKWDFDGFKEVVYGDYQGIHMYIIPVSSFPFEIADFVFLVMEYGSCNVCDTLLSILEHGQTDDEKFGEGQIKDLMQLSLHIIQRLHTFNPKILEAWAEH